MGWFAPGAWRNISSSSSVSAGGGGRGGGISPPGRGGLGGAISRWYFKMDYNQGNRNNHKKIIDLIFIEMSTTDK